MLFLLSDIGQASASANARGQVGKATQATMLRRKPLTVVSCNSKGDHSKQPKYQDIRVLSSSGGGGAVSSVCDNVLTSVGRY